jgi:hypothetical protein
MKKSLLSFFAVALVSSIFFQPSCSNIKLVEQTPDLLFNKNEISLNNYDVYVHGSNGVFKLEDPHISGDTLYEKNSLASADKDAAQNRESVDVYSDGPIRSTIVSAKEKIILTKKQIRSVLFPAALRTKETPKNDDDDGLGIALGLLVLLIILGALIIWLVIYLIIQSSNAAAQSSSNGSGSGSNSNSGNSSGNGGGSSSGCYIATMVYGDYDAPQVMTLRKFRDETLSRSSGGRAFIRWYYSWSPGFVKKYNHLSWLHKIIRVILNGVVRLLS